MLTHISKCLTPNRERSSIAYLIEITVLKAKTAYNFR